MSAQIVWPCPHCGKTNQSPQRSAGGHGQCDACKRPVSIPSQLSPEEKSNTDPTVIQSTRQCEPPPIPEWMSRRSKSDVPTNTDSLSPHVPNKAYGSWALFYSTAGLLAVCVVAGSIMVLKEREHIALPEAVTINSASQPQLAIVQEQARNGLRDEAKPAKVVHPEVVHPAGEWITSTERAILWNENPQPNEMCSWSGKKDSRGYATGPGMVVWTQRGVISDINCGSCNRGISDGVWYLMNPNGNVAVMYFENGIPIPVKPRMEILEGEKPIRVSEKAQWATTSKGVKIWNDSPQPNETCSWYGDKDALGYANGSGMVVWYQQGEISNVACGSWRGGKGDGVLTIIDSEGKAWLQRHDEGESLAVQLKLVRAEPIVRAQAPSQESDESSSGELTTGQKIGIAAIAAAGLWLVFKDNDKSTANSSSPSQSSSKSSGRMEKRFGSCSGCGGDGVWGDLNGSLKGNKCRRCGGTGQHDEWVFVKN